VAARHGVNITTRSTKETPWYDGPTVLEQIDAFEKPNTLGLTENVFRMPVQNIYKFTGSDDDRRIVAGTISTGTVKIHDEVIFHPSGKRTKIKSIESFHAEPATTAAAGEAVGFTMTTQIYIRPGELMCRADEEPAPRVGTRFRVNMFWMGRAPMVMGREYRLKIGAMNVLAQLADIYSVLDASELSSVANKRQIDRHDVAECVIETVRPVAFDLRNDVEQTGRFVIVDDYEISGAGVILDPVEEGESLFEKRVREREYKWEKGLVAPLDRRQRFRHSGKLVIFNGPPGSGKRDLAKRVEADLFKAGCNNYYFGIANYFQDLDRFTDAPSMTREDHLQMLGELARVMADAGLLFITTLADIDSADLERLRLLSGPNEPFVVNLGTSSLPGDAVAVQLLESPGPDDAVKAIVDALMKREVLQDYVI
jgi:bifunctional enzyme CysN/CysC